MSTSGEHRRNPVFWIAFVTMLAIFVYSGAWLTLDLLMKLGITPKALDAEAEAIQAELSVWNDIAFYSAFTLTIPSLYLAWRGRDQVLITYAVAIFAGVVDWVLLIDAVPKQTSLLGFLVFSGQLFVYVYLVAFALRKNPALL